MTARTPSSDRLALIRKYNQPGPRYTSYPTATHFTSSFERDELMADLRACNARARPLSLYLHLPFCETLCWFCGCTTVIGRDHGPVDRYLDALAREIAIIRPLVHPDSRIVQVHFGGGTPNFLRPDQIGRLAALLRENFAFAPRPEISVELDPRRLSVEQVLAFRELGASRASLGIQDFNPAVQQAVNRIQPFEQCERAVAWLRTAGFVSLNLDLIYGLPGQTASSFARTIELALDLRPDRFAIFSYAHVPWMKPAQRLLEARLPTADEKLAMFSAAIEILTARGFLCIGMDHFARPDDELARAQRAGSLRRNFQGYSTQAEADIYGFGMSAISQTPSHYRQNEKNLAAYERRVAAGELPVARACFPNAEDRLRREIIMCLMCDLKLDFSALSQRLGIDFHARFAPELLALREPERDGLVELHPDGLTITEIGRLFVRNLAMIFDARLPTSQARFASTV